MAKKMMKKHISPHKGGRTERIYARMKKESKVKLLARVESEGYASLADWLEAQAVAQPTLRGADLLSAPAKSKRLALSANRTR